MEDDSGGQCNEDLSLRAITLVAMAGFVVNNRSLKESCLAICNSCRESLQQPCLKLDINAPRSLLAVFSPDVLGANAEVASRVLLPKRVLKVKWRFHDPTSTDLVEGVEQEEVEEQEEGKGIPQDREDVERDLEMAWDFDLTKVLWPEGMREIYLDCFNRPVDNVVWPEGLEILSFHMPGGLAVWDMQCDSGTEGICNRPLDGVTFPAGLREIFLGIKFNQDITGVAWPDGLERLSMPGFNQPTDGVQWPSRLKTLEFIKPYQFEQRQYNDRIPWDWHRAGFDQPLGMSLPMRLETLWLSDNFGQSLRGVTWPSGLVLLGLGSEVTQESIDGVLWPPSLRKIVFSNECLRIQDAPSGCEVVPVEPYRVSDSDQDDDYDEDLYDLVDDPGLFGYGSYEYDSCNSEDFDPERHLWL